MPFFGTLLASRRVIALTCVLSPLLTGAATAKAADAVDFNRDVLPILASRCFECHGPDASTRKANLRLDGREGAIAARDGVAAVVPGRPDASALVARVSTRNPDDVMPPPAKGPPLSAEQVRVLRRWIAAGADYAPHWAFVPPARPPLPDVRNQVWPRRDLDRFVLHRLEREGITPAPEASRETFVRRATLDLLGLPPTPGEVEAFVADASPGAYETLVDRLLASPNYGERYGRHWLDVARYADSGGFETDIFFGHARRYRDYVIHSLNADKPFNRFVREQIAGDELYPDDLEARVATGLYTVGPVLQEAGMVAGKLEYDQLTDFVDTTGAAFLGLTVGCARCHDHKYDPVTQRDYFGLQALFAASDQYDFSPDGKSRLRGRASLKNTQAEFELEQARTRAARAADLAVRDAALRRVGDYYIEEDEELNRRKDLTKGYPAVVEAARRHREALARGTKAEKVGGGNAELDGLLAELGERVMEMGGPLGTLRRTYERRPSAQERRSFLVGIGTQNLNPVKPEGFIDDLDQLRLDVGARHLTDASRLPVRVLAHRDRPIEVRLLKRGELEAPGDIVPPALPVALAGAGGGAAPPADLPPNRRRAALAEWVASPQNPLTARVIVNRVWQWHFGHGLVRTASDFGIAGDRPTHPELLDFLADEFVRDGWSLKRLHRRIMLSATYRMSSSADAGTVARDPDNRLLARFQPRRLEAEAVWDGLRAVAGTLKTDLYGLPVAPPLDGQEQIGNFRKWPVATAEEADRRAIYILVKRSFRFPMLSAFDPPDNIASCARRDVTSVPNQALTLLNNRTMREQSAAFAARLTRETGGDPERAAERAWLHAYGRTISGEERARAVRFLQTGSLADLCLALFNTNEFIYLP